MIRSIVRIFRALSSIEKVIALFLLIVLVTSSFQLVWAFYKENSDVTAAEGGEYKEGLVGRVQQINPVLAFANNEVDSDIARLIFSGLMKYNPTTRSLENDIATHTLSVDKTKYTFTIMPNAYWHDGVPVTSEDVIFTFRDVIQNEGFSNQILRDAFRNVSIEKIDDQTMTFTLEKPYKFFIANLTVGLLPQHILSSVPVENFHLSEFNIQPIGTGPYAFQRIVHENEQTDVYLQSFDDYYGQKGLITNVVMSVFPDWDSLNTKITELDGFRVQRDRNQIALGGKHTLFDYSLAQYVAFFFNTKSKVLQNPKVRLGMQLATNKQEIIDGLDQARIIDTPLLEIDRENWVYQFDKAKAAGAFVDTEWKIPGKEYEEGAEGNEDDTTEAVTYISEPNGGSNALINTPEVVLAGTAPEGTVKVFIDDYESQLFSSTKRWTYKVSVDLGTLKEGENIYKVYAVDSEENKTEVDAIKIEYISDKESFDIAFEAYEAQRKENEEKELLSYSGITRVNDSGEELKIRILTHESPAWYKDLAQKAAEQWQEVGVSSVIEVLSGEEFQTRVVSRDYDVLLFGQNLGYNTDAYPYWHSSQAGENGVNFSEYASLAADALLEEIRATHDEAQRQTSLGKLQDTIAADTPAIFLYTPIYSYAVHTTVNNVTVNNLAIHSDRFNTFQDWFIKQRFSFQDDASWFSFVPWVFEHM